MENKYYTPTKEEFHIGFEYSCLVYKGNVWRDDMRFGEIDDTDTKEIVEDIELGRIRVKYLDVADIESLGFKCNGDDLRFCGTRGEITVQQCTYSYCARGLGVWITKGDVITLFSGEIKNKSELKKVLKQIGYEE